jgi:hypothetical protein
MNEAAADIQRHGAIASHLLPLAEGSFLPATNIRSKSQRSKGRHCIIAGGRGLGVSTHVSTRTRHIAKRRPGGKPSADSRLRLGDGAAI